MRNEPEDVEQNAQNSFMEVCATSPQPTSVVSKSVLVVDPGRQVVRVLQRLLSNEKWEVQTASDNRAALLLVERRPFDLIVTSERSSGREDVDLLRKIRAVHPHIRMIILTDRSTPEDVIASMRENVFSYFRAPFEPYALSDMIRDAIAEPSSTKDIEVICATPQWVRLIARCTKITADRLIQFFRQADLPDAEKDDVAVAAHEILLNAMEHGGKFDANNYVEVGYLRSKHAVACRIKDPGQGFSFEELRHAVVSNSPGDLFSHLAVREEKGLRPGGFGIMLAKKLVDDVIYCEHGNDVVLVKYLDSLPRQEPFVQEA
jgi:DNA-binding response OmpR family regulator